MITTTLLLSIAAGQPAIEESLATPTLREGRIGTVTWSAPVECGDFADAAGDARSELESCEHDFHVWVTMEDTGWVGHRQWQGTSALQQDEDDPQADCRDTMMLLASHAATHCVAADSLPEPLVGSAGGDNDPPITIKHLPALPPPPPSPSKWSPLLIETDVLLLAGFGRDDQAFGRGGTLGLGFDGGGWRAMALVAYEQLFHMGEEESEMRELVRPNTHFSRGSLRVCNEVLHGAKYPGDWDVALPLCGGVGIGQIRDPGTLKARGERTLWSGVEGSMSLVMRRRGPVAFRAGFDLVMSFPGGTAIGKDERFYEPEDFGARLHTGLELRPEWLRRVYRKERRQERTDRRERRQRRRNSRE